MKLLGKKEPYEVKTGLTCDATDYNVYFPSIGEKILWFLIGMAASGAVLYIFYEKILCLSLWAPSVVLYLSP